MFGALLHSPLPRLIPIGLVLLALQKTLFVELQPFGVILQIVMAFAAAMVGVSAHGGPIGMILHPLREILVSVSIGVVLGYVVHRLVTNRRKSNEIIVIVLGWWLAQAT